MSPDAIGAAVDGSIALFLGVYMSRLGFRISGKRPGESFEYDRWHESHGRIFRVAGLLLTIYGTFRVLMAMFVGR